MHIIIVGAGEVGNYLAGILVEEQHEVAIIESDEALVRALDERLAARVIHGTGVSRQSLRQAGIDKADLVLAVTDVDEANLMACMTATRYGRARTVARVRRATQLPGGTMLRGRDLGIDLLVGMERAVAREAVGLLGYQGAGEVHYLADGRVALLDLPLSADSPLTHEPLSELRDVFPEAACAVAATGPRGVRLIEDGDTLATDERAIVLTRPEDADAFWILSGKPWHNVRHVLILGCGSVGFAIARVLEARDLSPTIVERDAERVAWAARQLERSIVLHGDATDPALLREQLADQADAVMVALDDDEKSVLVGLFAKHLGARKVIVRSNQAAYTPIAFQLGVDAMISPKRAVADEILRFVRQGPVVSTYVLGDRGGEVLDLRVPAQPAHDILDRPLRELALPAGAVPGVLVRDGDITIATGDTTLRPGDALLVVCLAPAVAAVQELFR